MSESEKSRQGDNPIDQSGKKEEYVAVDSKIGTDLLKVGDTDLTFGLDSTKVVQNNEKIEYATDIIKGTFNKGIDAINNYLGKISYVKAKIMGNNPDVDTVKITKELNSVISIAKEAYIKGGEKDIDGLISNINQAMSKYMKEHITISDNISNSIASYSSGTINQ